MNIALGVITVAGLTRDKVIGSRWSTDIGFYDVEARARYVFPLARASILDTCSIIRFLTRLQQLVLKRKIVNLNCITILLFSPF